MSYREIYKRWQDDPEAYWLNEAKSIDWDEAPTQALFDRGENIYEWYADAKVNTCYNAVDRHVKAGRGAQAAIIHDSPVTGTKHTITYAELQTRVASLAGALPLPVRGRLVSRRAMAPKQKRGSLVAV